MSRPEQTFKAGAVRASVFLNTIERGGQTIPIRKVVLEVRYRDKDGQWKSSNSFSLNEIPKASTVLQQAYEYLLAQSSADRQEHNPGAAGEAGHNTGTPGAPGAPGSPGTPGSAGHPEHPGNTANAAATPAPAHNGPRLIGTYQG